MKLQIVKHTSKHAVINGLIALLFFGLVAIEEANASELEVTANKNTAQVETTQAYTTLSEHIALVTQLEKDAEKSKYLLGIIEQQFENQEVDATTIFIATIQVQQIEDALAQAKLKMILSLNKLNEPELHKLLAHK